MSRPVSRIEVGGEHGYQVLVGCGLLGEVAPLLAGASQVAVLHPPTLPSLAEAVAAELTGAGLLAHRIELPDGEAAKTLAVAGQCFDRLAELGFTRSDAVVGLGGGATTDLAGWVAASWLRGVRLVQLPTTLAGMVDAAIGGKTGINIGAGKNLVGLSTRRSALCDLSALATLPAADYRAGLAEVVKSGFIADPVILDLIEADPGSALLAGNPAERELIERTVAVKAAVVSADLTEQGLREILNYGHTLGHAIEHAEHYRWRHGDAVSVGLVFAAELGRLSGRLDQPTADRHGRLLAALGLPISYHGAGWDQLLAAMRLDKKARGATLRFVLLDGLARPTTVSDPEPALLAAAYTKVASR